MGKWARLLCVSVSFSGVILLLQGQLAFPEDEKSATQQTTDTTVYSQVPEANTLYVQAREALSRSDPWTGGSLDNARKAVRLLEQATEKDPTFAQAYLDLASVWGKFGYSIAEGISATQRMPKIRAAVLKAVELDPNSASAQLYLASISYNYYFDWDTADRAYQTAIQLAPDNATNYALYGWFLGSMGRFEAALAAVDRAHELDPSLWWNDVTRLLIYYWKGDYDTAGTYSQRARQHTDNTFVPYYTGILAAAQHDYDTAIADLEQSVSFVRNGGGLATLAYIYAQAGNVAKAREMLNELENGPQQMTAAYRIVAVYLALGDKDAAIKWLQTAYEERDGWFMYIKVDPILDPLRSDPRFQDILHRMNFPQTEMSGQ